MKQSLVEDTLCCPVDHAFPLAVEDAVIDGGEITSAVLRCPECGAAYPVFDGIPRFLPGPGVEEEETAEAKHREAEARDADADDYDGNVPDYQTALEVATFLTALRIRRGDVVLDLGAGTGRLTAPMARAGAVVLAVDISPRSLLLNLRKCASIPGAEVHAVACDACYLPFRDAVGDKAASGMMLEHLPTGSARRQSIADIARVLKPGGRLAMTVYNYSWAKRRAGNREGYHAGALFYHRFERRELAAMLDLYNIRRLTGILNLPASMHIAPIDRLVSILPPIAEQSGELLFAVADRLNGHARNGS